MSLFNSSITRLLNMDDKGLSTVTDPMAMLYRKVLSDLHIGPVRWSQLLHEYCAKNADEIGVDRIPDFKGNLTKAVVSDKMSTYYLIRSLSILAADRMYVYITLTHKEDDGTLRKSTHKVYLPKEYEVVAKQTVEPVRAKLASQRRKLLKEKAKPILEPFAALYAKVLKDNGISSHRWAKLLSDYCRRNASKIGRRAVAHYKGNVTKEAASSKLSSTYLVRCLSLLPVENIEIGLELEFSSETDEGVKTLKTQHQVKLYREFEDVPTQSV